jgi:hypothetical protein
MAHRAFSDEQGTQWEVWEVHPTLATRERVITAPRLPPELLSGWLTFQSANEKRRLTPIPNGWEALSENRLGQLLADSLSVKQSQK